MNKNKVIFDASLDGAVVGSYLCLEGCRWDPA